MLSKTLHINLLSSGCIRVEGSSKKIIGGLHIIDIDTDNFLLLPPNNYPLTLSLNSYMYLLYYSFYLISFLLFLNKIVNFLIVTYIQILNQIEDSILSPNELC